MALNALMGWSTEILVLFEMLLGCGLVAFMKQGHHERPQAAFEELPKTMLMTYFTPS